MCRNVCRNVGEGEIAEIARRVNPALQIVQIGSQRGSADRLQRQQAGMNDTEVGLLTSPRSFREFQHGKKPLEVWKSVLRPRNMRGVPKAAVDVTAVDLRDAGIDPHGSRLMLGLRFRWRNLPACDCRSENYGRQDAYPTSQP